MSGPVRRNFADELLLLPALSIAPRRVVTARQRQSLQYQRLLASLSVVGLVEPLVVFPHEDRPGHYALLDGHLRLAALRQLRQTAIRCLVARSDEGFTYNQRVNRLSPDQAYRLVRCALQSGVSEERLRQALDADLRAPLRKRLNFEGLVPEVVPVLRKRAIAPATIDMIRKVTAAHQIAAVGAMARTGSFTSHYARALLFASQEEELASPGHAERIARVSPASLARIRGGTQAPNRDLRRVQTAFSEDIMQLTVAAPHLRKLIENERVRAYLAAHHPDTLDRIRSMLADYRRERT